MPLVAISLAQPLNDLSEMLVVSRRRCGLIVIVPAQSAWCLVCVQNRKIRKDGGRAGDTQVTHNPSVRGEAAAQISPPPPLFQQP